MIIPPRPYQVEPLRTFYRRQNILLAFDTGLGKTWCAVAAGEELLESATVDRILLVVPAGLKYQWAEAIARFTDLPRQAKKLKGETITIPDSRYCMVVDGTPDRRKRQYKLARETVTCNYLIIGYDNVSSDLRDVNRFRAEMIVLDEASAIKTLSSARTKSIKENLTAPWRMALTATPVDNRPDELFSIMEWVDADVLGRGDLFDLAYIDRSQWGDPIGYKNLHTLRRKLGDAMYRKSVDDPDVAPFMPDRKVLEWTYTLDVMTQGVYAAMARDLYKALAEAVSSGSAFNSVSHYAGSRPDESTPMGRIMTAHMSMEMLLDHPDLVRDSAIRYATPVVGTPGGSKYAWQVFSAGWLDDLDYSPKLRTLAARLCTLMDDPASKVIIFTRYRVMQRLIMDKCHEYGWDAVQFHGELSTAEQTAARARFMRDPACRVFVSTHAGERGTDLPVANWLINVEPVWSAGQADQINGRHMRTSSEHDDIFVVNMLLPGSIEERKLDQQEDKRKIARAIVDGDMPVSGRVDNSAASLKNHVEDWLTDHDPDGMVLLSAYE